jgi:hypothetical protein
MDSKPVIHLLTDDSSKEWKMYEHNFVYDVNNLFTQRPPYIFLDIYSANFLILKNDFSFKIGAEDLVLDRELEWSISSNKDSIKLGVYNFTIAMLTNNELFLRQNISTAETKTLPYYEYRFRKKD